MLTTPASNLGFQCMAACKKCCDRSCTFDRRKTKQLVQEDYENINMGNEFMFEFRYSSLLTVLAVAFLYSGGMPIMYPTAAAFFFITYWIDKCMLLKYYRRPIKFDNHLAKKTLNYFKWILLLHTVGFLLCYGLTPILQNDLFTIVPEEFGIIEQEEFNLFPYYFWLIALLVGSYLVWILFIESFIKIGNFCCSSKALKLNDVHFDWQEDFYQCISFKSLKHEFKSTKTQIRLVKGKLNTADHN